MEISQVKQLVSKIKAYYYYFSLEKESMNEWANKLKAYDFEDVSRKLDEHLKSEDSKEPPKLHYLVRNLLTIEEKLKSKDDYIVNCNLCGRSMSLKEYDSHYDKCLSIEYLLHQGKEKGENITREDLENCRADVLNRLYEKYKPQETVFKPQKI